MRNHARTRTLGVLLIGDVFGRPGRSAVARHLPEIKALSGADFVIANGENAAAGVGITPEVAGELFKAGVDVITTGNHVWRHVKEIAPFMEERKTLLRPLNYPPGAPGRGFGIYPTAGGTRIGVMNLQGRVFMEDLDCPFRSADAVLDIARLGRDADLWIVDLHAEASSEKMAMALHLDGRVTAVVGTHTHVPTADHRVLKQGTGFITDVGMTGCYDSIIGMRADTVMPKFVTKMPTRFEPAGGEAMLCGVLIRADAVTGRCQEMIPVRVGEGLSVRCSF
ncbi:2',3'-cyclic-nucleotide 2'-phosphodiesterase [Candidatus Magnetaquicoccaceae bacterium FCR-1]|uniref:2',3'-cyclic-nucleotide 2'-phosphodiesterase n=1 Tax=Candidatus Magnetaquiglobus chichijimensis TaxID=3141448 RepID=A0ABQ0CA08_9PROT